jgi:hypothetical protein
MEIFICYYNAGKYFTMRYKIAPSYSEIYLETERPQPLSDNLIESTIQDVVSGKMEHDLTDTVYTNFKKEMTDWLKDSKLNTISGFDQFARVDIINGCTQFIDSLYMKGPVQTLKGDYRYHSRLNPNLVYSFPGYLRKELPLIIAMPFPSTGEQHKQMKDILDECLGKQIAVHIDGAWITCCRDIEFDFNHPAILSFAISLSKGLGLGWNRIGLRWTRDTDADSITIMNDFHMNLRAPAMIGLHFIRNLSPDYLWNAHGKRYYKICSDFNLTPTKSIYLALRNGQPVGVSPLIRYLENADIS